MGCSNRLNRCSSMRQRRRHHSALPSTIMLRLFWSHRSRRMLPELLPGEAGFRPSGTLDVLDQLDRSELHLAMGPSAATGERFSRGDCCRISSSWYIARVIRAQGRRNYQPRSWPRSPSSKSRRSIRHRSCRERAWTIKAWPKTCDACAISVCSADSGDVGFGICPSAQRRQEHDKVSPPCFPSAVAFAQADRSCDDLAATAR